MSTEAAPSRMTFEDVLNSPEYQTKLNNCLEDVRRFAERVRAVAEGEPTDADIKQLKDEYEKISESTLMAHDSIPEDAKKDGQDLHIKGTDGEFMASARIKLLESLGNGNYDAITPARVLFEERVSPGIDGLYSHRERVYK